MANSTLKDVIETGIFAVAGMVSEVQESFPRIVEKGRVSLEPKFSVAKFVGQFAVKGAENEIRKRSNIFSAQMTDFVSSFLNTLVDSPTDNSQTHQGPTTTSSDRQSPRDASKTRTSPKGAAKSVASELPISGYTTLSAQQVIARLDSLNSSELETIYNFEISHRNRSSILREIDSRR